MGIYRALEELAAKRRLPPARPKPTGQMYEVQQIMDDRGTRAGNDKEYKVQWKGYSGQAT